MSLEFQPKSDSSTELSKSTTELFKSYAKLLTERKKERKIRESCRVNVNKLWITLLWKVAFFIQRFLERSCNDKQTK